MTVIDRKHRKFGCGNSANNSDTESLNLDNSVATSDTESLHNEPLENPIRRRPKPSKVQQVEIAIPLKKSCGRKKLRRYHNRNVLQTLSEEDENDECAIVIMESYKNPFERLMEDHNAMLYWNAFIDKPEEEQMKIVEHFSQKLKDNSQNGAKKTDKTEKMFKRISSKLRHSIKMKKNLSLEFINQCEDEFAKFFTCKPEGLFSKLCKTSFEKVLVFAVAQYHRLLPEDKSNKGNRIVNVSNPSNKNWMPAECFLADFIGQLRR